MDLVYLELGGTTVELIRYVGASVAPAHATEHLGYRMIALEADEVPAKRVSGGSAHEETAASSGPKDPLVRRRYPRAANRRADCCFYDQPPNYSRR